MSRNDSFAFRIAIIVPLEIGINQLGLLSPLGFFSILFPMSEPIKYDKGIIKIRFHNGMNNRPRAAVDDFGNTNTSRCIHRSKANTITAAHKEPYNTLRKMNIDT